MNITIEQLITCIEASKYELDVCTPSMDYYRRAGEIENSTITVICPDKLIEALGEVVCTTKST